VIARAFLAVYPSAEAASALDAHINRIVPSTVSLPLRWERAAQRHCTLRFLGRVADELALLEQMRIVARDLAPFSLQLCGAGAFPSVERARVVWCGIGGEVDALANAADAFGYDDPRPYRPHLTLARTHHPIDCEHFVAAIGAEPIGPPFRVDTVALVASDTQADGAVHTVMGTVELGGGSPSLGAREIDDPDI